MRPPPRGLSSARSNPRRHGRPPGRQCRDARGHTNRTCRRHLRCPGLRAKPYGIAGEHGSRDRDHRRTLPMAHRRGDSGAVELSQRPGWQRTGTHVGGHKGSWRCLMPSMEGRQALTVMGRYAVGVARPAHFDGSSRYPLGGACGSEIRDIPASPKLLIDWSLR